jgi:hypothetical protein
MARLVATSLMNAVPPDLWEETTAGMGAKSNDASANVTPQHGHRADAPEQWHPKNRGPSEGHNR